MRKTLFQLAAAIALTLAAILAPASGASASSVMVMKAYARASATPTATSGAAYVSLMNHADEGDRIVAVSSPVAKTAEIHKTEEADGVVKIGVMNDMSGLYADISGPGALVAARMAVEDFQKTSKAGLKVEVVGADHQNKPDIGSNIARTWFDVDKVDVIVDVPTSSVALAINQVVREKNKVFLNSGAATSDLTGKACTPYGYHWAFDTRALAVGTLGLGGMTALGWLSGRRGDSTAAPPLRTASPMASANLKSRATKPGVSLLAMLADSRSWRCWRRLPSSPAW